MKRISILIIAALLMPVGTDVNAKMDTACKNPIRENGRRKPTLAQAKASANANWALKVTGLLGSSWADFSKAHDKEYQCDQSFHCQVRAKPCKLVPPQNLGPSKYKPARVRTIPH